MPRVFAHLPFPSMMMAMWRGISLAVRSAPCTFLSSPVACWGLFPTATALRSDTGVRYNDALNEKFTAFWIESQGNRRLTFHRETDILDHSISKYYGTRDGRSAEHVGNDEADTEDAGKDGPHPRGT
jgi:hypothetical protein